MEEVARALLIHASDNVAVALEDIASGSIVAFGTPQQRVNAREAVPFGHKIAVKEIANGDLIMKYGAPVGCTTVAIPAGAWVHSHNAESRYAPSLEKKL